MWRVTLIDVTSPNLAATLSFKIRRLVCILFWNSTIEHDSNNLSVKYTYILMLVCVYMYIYIFSILMYMYIH